MRTLYHYPLCPYSRKIRLILAEKKLDFSAEIERFWEKRPEFMKLNPAGQVPILVDLNGSVINDSMAISEYLEDAYPERPLIGEGLLQRAEVRRLVGWFDSKFASEVSVTLLMEKNIKRYLSTQVSSGPNSAVIRNSQSTVHSHLEYISWLVDRRNWLAGDDFSLADIAAAAHLSVVDYMGDIAWDKHPIAKDWYARIKSRPTFRSLLLDRVPALAPSSQYADLDF
ncbi:MAG: glutathione S-transferase family protein [Alphaproteobacteria bacterium]|nr:glutathione S-transferase family protein [Alphaproteobacteria bacterium]